jgi:hypothetical protein
MQSVNTLSSSSGPVVCSTGYCRLRRRERLYGPPSVGDMGMSSLSSAAEISDLES